jgi:hypothetical protein
MGTTAGAAPADELKSTAVSVLQAMLTNDRIGIAEYEHAVERVLDAATEAQLSDVLRALPPPVAMTPADRRLDQPLKIRGGTGRLRLDRRWQLARQTSIRAELGSVTIDLGEAEFDGREIDLNVYTGWGSITLFVPPGVGVQLLRTRGTVISRIDPPIPGFPLVKLRAQTNLGRIRLRSRE